jgi:hypothetical protein
MEWWNIGRMSSKQKRELYQGLLPNIPLFHYSILHELKINWKDIINHWEAE